MLIYRSLKIIKLLFILYIFFIHFLYIYFIYIFIIYDLKTFKYEKCILMKKTIFFLKIKKYRKLNKIFKSIQETKLWKISLKSVCISRQCSFISKKRKGLERWEREEGSGAVSISISCISSHISRAEVNFFRVDTSNKAFQIFAARREKRT